MLIEDLFNRMSELGLSEGAEPNYIKVKTPVNRTEGWVIQFIWMHHDGDIVEKITTGLSFEDAATMMMVFINENERGDS